ncbi:hypothetical protein [Enterococcus sp. LJL90]
MKKDLSQYFLMLDMALLVIVMLTSRAPISLVLNKGVAVTDQLIQNCIIFVAAIFSLMIVSYLSKITKSTGDKSS